MQPVPTGQPVYEYTVDILRMGEYGVSFAALMAGQETLPPMGAKFDVWFEGPITGKVDGMVKGVDYLTLRADGRFDLHIHAEIETNDGCRISLFADGVCLTQPGSPVAELRENVTLFTACEPYIWVNNQQFWAVGTVDLAKQQVHIQGYVA